MATGTILRKNGRGTREMKLPLSALGRLETFETETIERLTRVEENLRLLRQELVGNGRPGRITQLETLVDQVRTSQMRERGIVAGISLTISFLAAILARWLHF